MHDREASRRVTSWAYANAEQAGAMLWVEAEVYEPSAGWQVATGSASNAAATAP